MADTIQSDPHLAEAECCECGEDITVTYGPIHKVLHEVTGYPKMAPTQDLNSELVGYICEACASQHYQNGDASWGGDGSLLMMPSYYE